MKKEEGISTLGAMDIWFDESVKRLNTEQRGKYIGDFKGDDKILTIMQSGHYRLIGFDLSTHFDDDLIVIEKYDPDRIVSAAYFDAAQGFAYLKRFQIEETDKKTSFIGDEPASKLMAISLDDFPIIELVFDAKKNERVIENQEINVAEFIAVKSFKAKGKRLTTHLLKTLSILEPLITEGEDETEDVNGNEEEDLLTGDDENIIESSDEPDEENGVGEEAIEEEDSAIEDTPEIEFVIPEEVEEQEPEVKESGKETGFIEKKTRRPRIKKDDDEPRQLTIDF
jgi:topoisomerase-4 subunit A